MVARASRELPPGPVVDRLRNYCGRVWDVLGTPSFTDASLNEDAQFDNEFPYLTTPIPGAQ